MKLTVAGNQIALTEGAVISIERSTPFLNDDTGSFSFPFPVPTLPNQRLLGWPGNLERTGDIPDQTFVLETQVCRFCLEKWIMMKLPLMRLGSFLKADSRNLPKEWRGKNWVILNMEVRHGP